MTHAPATSMCSIRTATPQDTRAAAAALSALLEPGDVVALSGDLGAGKTCFVQGAAAALGVELPVTSPTFVLVKFLPGRVPVVHVDVYRLERLVDVHDLGEDVFAPDVVTFVEWGDTIRSLLPDDRIEVALVHDEVAGGQGTRTQTAPGSNGTPDGDPHVQVAAPPDDGLEAVPRRLTVHAYGPRWQRREQALHDICASWGG